MSMQAAQVALFAKLFWIWIGLLISVFVFWRLRRIWLKRQVPAAATTASGLACFIFRFLRRPL